MDNQEDILDALRDFEKKPACEIPPLLEEYLGRVASTGETLFPWPNMKALFVKKLDGVMQQFEEESHMDSLPPSPNVENVKFEAMRTRILHAIDKFHGAPFTIQRLCELITNPKKHYKRADKFLRGVEKNILVVSTVDPFGRKVVSESKHLVNGLDSNGHMMGQGDAAHVDSAESATKAASLAHEWSSEGVTSSSSDPHKLSFEEGKTQDMLCSDDSGEATSHKGGNSPEQSSGAPSEPGSSERLQEQKDNDSGDTTEVVTSEQATVTSVDNHFDKKEKEIQSSVPDEETQNQPLVFTGTLISHQTETVSDSTTKDDMSNEFTEEKLSEKDELVSSGEDVDKPQTVSEEMPDDVDSSSTALPCDDGSNETTSEAASVSPSELETESGDVQKTEEPSSSDDEDRLGAGGDGGIHQGLIEGGEEGVSSTESSALLGAPVPQPQPTSPCEQSPADDTAPSQSSSSERDTATPAAKVTEDTSSEAAVTSQPEPCTEIPKSDTVESPESSSSSSVKNQPEIADSENVSSSSESSGVAMETEESMSKVSELSSDNSTTENFCSTSDIPEPQTETEEPMEQD